MVLKKIEDFVISLLTNIATWAFLITLVAAWFISPYFLKYQISIYKSENFNLALKPFLQIYYEDIDNDNIYEMIDINYEKDFPCIGFSKNDTLLNAVNVQHNLVRGANILVKDIDKDNYKEVFYITSKEDSLFLNSIKFDSKFNVKTAKKLISIVNQNFKGEYDVTVSINSDLDINNDSFFDIYIYLSAGYSFQPRQLVAYDFMNDSLYKSEPYGAFIGVLPYPILQNNDTLLISNNSFAVGNYDTSFKNINYPDTSVWFMGFNKKLEFAFEPVEFEGNSNVLYVSNFHRNDSTFFVICKSNYQNSANLSIMLYSPEGKLMSTFDVVNLSFNEIVNVELFGKNLPQKVLFTDKANNMWIINEAGNGVETRQIELTEGKSPYQLQFFDLDKDGEIEKIFVNSQNIVVYREDLTEPCNLLIDNVSFRNASTFVKNDTVFTNIFNDKTNYTLHYSRNSNYFLQYVLYLAIFAFVFLFLFVFQKARTYKLKKENDRLNNLVTERTYEISCQNEILSQQKEEILTQADQLMEALEKLQSLDNYKQNLTAMIVHDLKNPLNTVLGLAQNPEVIQAGKQMLNMVLNILDVQKFEDAQIKIYANNFSVAACLTEALQQTKILYERKSITINNKVSKNHAVNAEYELIQRVFINLLTNSIKYSPNNGTISILSESTTENKRKYIKIIISDNGLGIPKDKLNAIFDKFVQVEAKNSGGVRSTGLGLTFCKLAIEAHNGTIGVESELGSGARFWFMLPEGEMQTNILSENEYIDEIQQHELLLNQNDKIYLMPFVEKLHELSVYEFSDIKRIMKDVDSKTSANIEIWKKQMLNAVKACNEELYYKLINLL